jgi:uncharacterized protein YbaR (Trm112 family)
MPSLLETLLAQLVCPVCHAALAFGAGTIDCASCHRRYPIVDGLPVLIESRAIREMNSHEHHSES